MNDFHFRVELTDRGNGRQWYAFATRDAAQRFMDGLESNHRAIFPDHDLQLFAERVDSPMPTPRHGLYRPSDKVRTNPPAEFLEKLENGR